jgi:hypothetical protein
MEQALKSTADENLIAYCGLYCGACPRYVKGKCPGCLVTEKSQWCNVRPCNIGKGYKSCAQCSEFPDVAKCRTFNPMIIRFGEFVMKTSRKKGIQMIKEKGVSEFASYMAANGLVSLKKGKG